jgi:hypothetical protein
MTGIEHDQVAQEGIRTIKIKVGSRGQPIAQLVHRLVLNSAALPRISCLTSMILLSPS